VGRGATDQQVPFTVTVENVKEIVFESAIGDLCHAIWDMWINPTMEH
jgi:hypothetical protein